jgi:hypothetical protein
MRQRGGGFCVDPEQARDLHQFKTTAWIAPAR